MPLALRWDAEPLRQALDALLPGVRVQAVAEVDSTSTQLMQALRGGDTAPRLLVAELQTAGRGRNGRTWVSAAGDSLTFSLALPFAPADWSGLSLAVGVALAEAIEPAAAVPRLQLKWPNDLWLADEPGAARWRKLGGILIETVAAGSARACVLGIGLNVRPAASAVATALGSGYACVQEMPACSGLDAPGLLARVAPPLVQALRRFEREGLAPFAEGFARRDLLRGRAVETTPPGAPGVAAGIDAQGALRLRGANGERLVASGEVSVRPATTMAEAGT